MFRDHLVSCAYFTKNVSTNDLQLHCFRNASEVTYSAVIYLKATDAEGAVHVALVMAKTKVAPIKQLSIPRLELCDAMIPARLFVT